LPFNPQATYVGGQLLGQGLANLGQGIGGTIQGYQDIADKANQSDALMNYLSQQQDPATGKPIVDQKALQTYMQHSARQRAFVAGGLTAGMSLVQHLQQYAQENRESLAHTNLYQAQAAQKDETFEPSTSVVKDPITGEYHSFVRTSKGQVQPMKQQGAAPAEGQEEIDPETGKAFGVWRNGKLVKYPAPQDPMKAAIAEQIKGTASPTPSPASTSAAPAATPGPSAAPVRVNSVAEAQALPPGTMFVDPQGTLRRR
jgi:hypothetical protein